jgi:TonB family protein
VIDKAALSRVFRSRAGALRSCYERQLKKNPKIGGKLVVQFKIGAAGRVTSARVAKDTVGAPAVGQCVLSRIRSWKFPKPEGGSVSVSKAILFSPGS